MYLTETRLQQTFLVLLVFVKNHIFLSKGEINNDKEIEQHDLSTKVNLIKDLIKFFRLLKTIQNY